MAIAERELLAPTKNRLYTEEEYLALEEAAEEKSEYINGEIRPMSGGTYYHSFIAAKLITALNVALDGTDCDASSADTKVRAARNMFYPDVSVVCGAPVYHGRSRMVITNPILVAEVLSPSTSSIDRGDKMQDYLQIETLEVYLLVTQSEPLLEMVSRQADRSWKTETVAGMDAALTIPALSISLKLADVYRRVVFEATEEL